MVNTKGYGKEDVNRKLYISECNYANMFKRLKGKASFSNFAITYYSIALIVFSLTAEFFPQYFSGKMSSYFGIILSVVVLAYSLVISNAKYTERAQNAEQVLKCIKSKKRELTEGNFREKHEECEKIMQEAEYRSEMDFFKTLKQLCKENDVKWYWYKKDLIELKKYSDKREIAQKLNEYLSSTTPFVQQMRIVFQRIWNIIILIVPVILFAACFFPYYITLARRYICVH